MRTFDDMLPKQLKNDEFRKEYEAIQPEMDESMGKLVPSTDLSTITACGECCVECKKKLSGECPGCIEADGAVPEWKESGRCKIHTCVREHGVQFCGLCREFPCDKIPKLIPWNPNIVEHLTNLRDAYETVYGERKLRNVKVM